jgi:hypothetical protein
MIRHLGERARRRRLRLYVVGMAKTGTTTMADVFGQYRSYHEIDRRRMVPTSARAIAGELSTRQATWEMRRRSIRFGLEVDSTWFLWPFVPDLRALYPDAQFVVLIRDCFSWLDSMVEHWIRTDSRGGPRNKQPLRRALFAGADAPSAAADDRALTERGYPPVGAMLERWSTTYTTLIADDPEHRTLVLRTEDLDGAREQLAAFCRVAPSTLATSVRRNAATRREGLLAEVPVRHVIAEAERACGPVMQQFWGDSWTELVTRVAAWQDTS